MSYLFKGSDMGIQLTTIESYQASHVGKIQIGGVCIDNYMNLPYKKKRLPC